MSKVNYEFAPEYGRFFDVFSALHISSSENTGSESPFKEGTDPRIEESYARVNRCIRENIGQLGFLFAQGEEFPEMFENVYNELTEGATSLEGLVRHIQRLNPTEFAAKVLSFFDCGNTFSLSFYKSALENRAMLTEILNNTGLASDVKWDIVNFIQAPESGLGQLADLIFKVSKEVDAEYQTNAEFITQMTDEVRRQLEASDMDVLTRHSFRYDELVGSGEYATVRWSVAMFIPFKTAFLSARRRLNVYLGYRYDSELRPAFNAKYNRSILFKAFGDNTRFEVLDSLVNGEMFTSEISKKLGTPMTSLIHHISILERANVVTRRTEGKRVYFRLNPDMLRVASEIIKGYC